MMNWKKAAAASIMGAVLAGCGAGDKAATDEVAVSVNGETLMQSKIDEDVAKIIEAQGGKIPAEQINYAKKMIANQLVQSFISTRVLVAKAKADGLTATDADIKEREAEFLKAVAKMPDAPKSLEEQFKKFPLGEERGREEFMNGILIDKLIRAYTAKASADKDYAAEAQKMIDGIVSNNATIATSEAAALKKLKAELDKLAKDEKALAEKFTELAKANSDCPSSAKGGDLGEFTHGQMVKEFDEAAFSLPVGQVSEPVKTQFGYHLIMTTAKIPAVKAKDGKSEEPEKVKASHILAKTKPVQKVPTKEEVIDHLKKQGERSLIQNFVLAEIKKADIKASEAYKQFLPQKDEAVETNPAK